MAMERVVAANTHLPGGSLNLLPFQLSLSPVRLRIDKTGQFEWCCLPFDAVIKLRRKEST